MRKNVILSATILMSLPALAVAGTVIYAHANHRINAETQSYKLTLNSDNCKFAPSSYGTSATTTTVENSPKTALGNPLFLTYENLMAPTTTSGFAQLKKNAGYLYSTYGVNGLTSITVTFTSGGQKNPNLYFGTSSNSWDDGVALESGKKYSAPSGNDFFNIKAGGNAIYISEIVLEYTCSSQGGGGSSSSSSSSSGSSESTPVVGKYYEKVMSLSSLDLNKKAVIVAEDSQNSGDYYALTTNAQSESLPWYIMGEKVEINDNKISEGSFAEWDISLSGSYYSFANDGNHLQSYVSSSDSKTFYSLNIGNETTYSDNWSLSFGDNGEVIAKSDVDVYIEYYKGSFQGYKNECKIFLFQEAGEGGSSSEPKEETWDNYYKAASINSNYGFGDLNYTVPTKGNVKLLVIPVELSDYPFSSSEIEDIKTLHGGNAEDTKYWESLSSFYSKSSYGQLNMTFEYSDVYKTGKTAKQFYDEHTDDTYGWVGAPYAMREAVSAYKAKNGNASTKKFDSDSDGLIDACIMIYSCPNVYDSAIEAIDEYGEAYWAYRWVDPELQYPDEDSPVGYNFFWASLDFFYEGTGTRESHTGIDAHTLIHETGHLLGADDYYNTFTSRQSGGQYSETNEPSGGVMMMAYNVQDHDIFTKMSYGWVKPYVVTGNAEITINPSNVDGDCIILTDSWNGHAWDEYIIMELFTPDGLNSLDAATPYGSTSGLSAYGVRMFHIDARLAKITDYDSDNDYYIASSYASDSEIKNGTLNLDSNTYWYDVAARNSAGGDASFIQGKGYDLITMMSPKNTSFTDSNLAKNSDLFKAGDSINLSSSKYLKSGKLNNGASLNYTISVETLSSSTATIKFSKN